MNRAKKGILILGIIAFAYSGSVIASSLREDMKYVVNHPIDSSLKGGKILCKAAIAGYAGYLTITLGLEALHHTINYLRYTNLNRLFHTISGPAKTCMIVAGLCLLAYHCGRSCLQDIRRTS